ncbi:MAG: adenylate/guanylate cyclase domain-containing protein, partial [Deltaproteobacteria bacterium]|nr:adenylate/guanylate cyclase domain-containing protein [Deltaproteobacteria bacterium]
AEPDIERKIKNAFQIPQVVVFTGHMLDRPGRLEPRFPACLEGQVKQNIRERLINMDGRIGFASGACGADIIFLETVLELGGQMHLVLPFNLDQFLKERVAIIPDSDWPSRLNRLMEKATDVIWASSQPMRDSIISFQYTNLLLLGLAKIKAKQFLTDVIPMAVWDGRPGDGLYGTAHTVEDWRGRGLSVEIIALDQLLGSDQSSKTINKLPASQIESPPVPTPEKYEETIKAILFADVVGFSKLGDLDIPLFVEYFLGGIAEVIAKNKYHPLLKATWGDGIYLIFDTVREAGSFALDLRDFTLEQDWTGYGIPKSLNLRISLHSGPVYHCRDPLMEKMVFSGGHVTRAARIEPITPPGHVYASSEFAAMAAADEVEEFSCEYVGLIQLAKKYGTVPLFHVRRSEIKVF